MTEKSEKPIGGFVRNRHLLILTIVTPLRGASTSRSGISVVNIELQDWVTAADNENIFSKVRDRLDDAAAELPAGAGTPEFDDKRGAVAFSMILALS